jgi:hypothetical protein
MNDLRSPMANRITTRRGLLKQGVNIAAAGALSAQTLGPTQRIKYIATRELAAFHPERGDFAVGVCIGNHIALARMNGHAL